MTCLTRLLNRFRHQTCELHDAFPTMCQQLCSLKKVSKHIITNNLYIFNHFLPIYIKKNTIRYKIESLIFITLRYIDTSFSILTLCDV